MVGVLTRHPRASRGTARARARDAAAEPAARRPGAQGARDPRRRGRDGNVAHGGGDDGGRALHVGRGAPRLPRAPRRRRGIRFRVRLSGDGYRNPKFLGGLGARTSLAASATTTTRRAAATTRRSSRPPSARLRAPGGPAARARSARTRRSRARCGRSRAAASSRPRPRSSSRSPSLTAARCGPAAGSASRAATARPRRRLRRHGHCGGRRRLWRRGNCCRARRRHRRLGCRVREAWNERRAAHRRVWRRAPTPPAICDVHIDT